MRIYLDNCCYNRPYDDQSFLVIRLETESKMQIQRLAKSNEIELVWSFMLDYENNDNPYDDIKEQISIWKSIATFDVDYSESVMEKANEYMSLGLRNKDALHLASAKLANTDFFITTDKGILNKKINDITVLNPIDFIRRYYDAQ